ncbi:MAG: MBL fold metallo-hydrolase [Spirochaetales bacterium]|nr:MBL fold metallo-hydrolase [Spirochaetales bacterium]
MKLRPLNNKKLELTNKGKLRLFFIGIGSAFSKKHNQTNLLVIKGKDHVLIDFGTKGPQALYDVGVSVTQIRNILITHSHADHIGGLEEIALMGRYVTKQKPNMIITEAYQHILWDMSLRGGIAFNEDNANNTLSFYDFFNIIRPVYLNNYPRETFGTQVGNIQLKLMRTKHIPDNSDSWESSFWSCGLIIDDRILFTSDTRFDPDLVYDFEQKFRFETIFHDCQFFTGGVHASLEEINSFAPALKKKMYLTHYGDNWEQFEPTVKRYGFAGLARQNMYYEF